MKVGVRKRERKERKREMRREEDLGSIAAVGRLSAGLEEHQIVPVAPSCNKILIIHAFKVIFE